MPANPNTLLSDAAPALAWIAEQQAEAANAVEHLCNINSGSFNGDGVNAVIDALLPLLLPLGGDAERLDVPPLKQLGDDGQWLERPLGQALRVRKRPEAPLQIMLGGHLDTVFPKDSAFQTVVRPDANTLHGPGVADLKGGLVVMINALRALEQSPHGENIGWTILLNPDEEIGSRSSMPLLESVAKQAQLGLIYEPAYPDGGLAGARKGSGNFEVLVRGKAAHAGREHHLGRNAIAAVARITAAIDDLNGKRDGVTINVGKLSGGGPVNVVPELGILRLNVRVLQPDDQQWVSEQLNAIVSDADTADGISATLHGGFTRPPKPIDQGIQRLIDHLHASADTVGCKLSFTPTGGCCDGNNLAAFGLPNIDNLGVVGGNIHSDAEYMHIPSLTERAQLSATLLIGLASGALPWEPKQ
ncbi:hydrolase [bacterium]|nr:hydrolase [bacterium]